MCPKYNLMAFWMNVSNFDSQGENIKAMLGKAATFHITPCQMITE